MLRVGRNVERAFGSVFDDVMVMSKDPVERQQRLQLWLGFRAALSTSSIRQSSPNRSVRSLRLRSPGERHPHCDTWEPLSRRDSWILDPVRR